jgi:uncharacterized repeat protein (TIGR03803 family)
MRITTQRWTSTPRCSLWASAFRLALFLALTAILIDPVQAQTYTVIHNFTGGSDGANPASGLTIDRAGNFYGTASTGGVGYGTVFKLVNHDSAWLTIPLYSFTGRDDGAGPFATMTLGPDGRLYGTTQEGGGSSCGGEYPGCGTVFLVTPPSKPSGRILGGWTDQVLHAFTYGGPDGIFPEFAELVFDHVGNIYGTTTGGGSGDNGTVYKLTRSGDAWTESFVHLFEGADGSDPWSGVIFDSAGNLYGVTESGGAYNYGAIYDLMPSGSGWTESVLYSLQGGGDGSAPYGGLIFDQLGNLYGTTAGTPNGSGTVFELIKLPNGSWTHVVLYRFSQVGYNGGPISSLVMDATGNLYGTTLYDGAYEYGSVFELTPSAGGWVFTDLHDFTGGSDGGYGEGSVILGHDGHIYGTAAIGGAYYCPYQGCGVVWEITP